MSGPDEFRLDMRIREIETRTARDGKKLIRQSRTNVIELDGSVINGDWEDMGAVTNYGDCFDKKQSLFGRIIDFLF